MTDPKDERDDEPAPAERHVDPALPVELAATRPRRSEPQELRPHSFEELKGEEVCVRAGGFDYRGTLVGADEAELYLKSETRWIVLPLDRITEVKRAAPRLVPPAAPPGFDDDG